MGGQHLSPWVKMPTALPPLVLTAWGSNPWLPFSHVLLPRKPGEDDCREHLKRQRTHGRSQELRLDPLATCKDGGVSSTDPSRRPLRMCTGRELGSSAKAKRGAQDSDVGCCHHQMTSHDQDEATTCWAFGVLPLPLSLPFLAPQQGPDFLACCPGPCCSPQCLLVAVCLCLHSMGHNATLGKSFDPACSSNSRFTYKTLLQECLLFSLAARQRYPIPPVPSLP